MLLFFAFVYFNNSSLFYRQREGRPLLLAHRGLGQTFSMAEITGDTNTAERVFEPEHPYLENTIPSMEVAFSYGADIVELDIHPTTDGQFTVFHDWILDYRTDGTGVTREHSMAELKSLDIGYGYTADDGKTYPFRGQGIGMMPTLAEVLDYFPYQALLIHIKSNDPLEGELLAQALMDLPIERLDLLTVYGGNLPIATLSERLPNLRVMSKNTMKKGLLSYMAIGWTGYVPASLRNNQLHLPQRYARFLWGWPCRFTDRMKKANTQFILVAGDGNFSEGFDTIEDINKLPAN